MFAIIRTGGRQYRVKANQVVRIDRLAGDEGDKIVFDDVLMVGGDETIVGQPQVDGACVAARLVSQARNNKVLAFKKRRRKHSQKIHGHRQHVSLVVIDGIFTDGAKPVFKEEVEAPKAKKTTAKDASKAKAADKAEVKTPKAESTSGKLTDLKGVGPALGETLAGAGLTLELIAGFTEADIARYDAELDLKGKITKNDWVAQAKSIIG